MSEFKPHNPPYLDGATGLDALSRIVFSLARETWVLRDRVHVLEALLAEAGVVERGKVDTFAADEAFAKMSELESDAFAERVFGAPFNYDKTIDEVVEQGMRLAAGTRERVGVTR